MSSSYLLLLTRGEADHAEPASQCAVILAVTRDPSDYAFQRSSSIHQSPPPSSSPGITATKMGSSISNPPRRITGTNTAVRIDITTAAIATRPAAITGRARMKPLTATIILAMGDNAARLNIGRFTEPGSDLGSS